MGKEDEAIQKNIRMRISTLNEILDTEQKFVEKLKFIVNDFKSQLDNREKDETDSIVAKGTVETLLSNIDEIYEFNQKLLMNLESNISKEKGYNSCIGETFLKFEKEFKIYSPYCSNLSRAQKKLNELTENYEFDGFVLGCFMLGDYKNEVSMEGFLLSPLQRLCRYPLLLKELVKHTPLDHPDHKPIKEAHLRMKDVCTGVNEARRQLEHLEKLEDLQNSISNWEGARLTDTCTRLIKQGSLVKISAGHIQERQFFLLDHLLLYCSKRSNTLRRKRSRKKTNSTSSNQTPSKTPTKNRLNGQQDSGKISNTGTIQRKKLKRKKSSMEQQKKWVFKGRISTEIMEIENLEDGTGDTSSGGYTVKYGWKVHNAAKNKWFVLIAKDQKEKDDWLSEFFEEREKRKSNMPADKREPIDVMHSRGKKIYFRAVQSGTIKDNKSKLKTYKKSVSGSDFVEFLKTIKEVETDELAIMLGQALLDCGIIHHVNDKCHFKNDSTLYRFRYDDGTYKKRGEAQERVAKGIQLYYRMHSLFEPVIKEKVTHLMSSYKQVIESRRFIDWLIENNDCRGKVEAIELGAALCELGILHHALDKSDFKYDSSLFKFQADEEASDHNKLRDLVSKKTSSKHDFRMINHCKTKTLLILNGKGSESWGFEARFSEGSVLVHKLTVAGQAQMQGMVVNQEILMLNNFSLVNVTGQMKLEEIIRYISKNHKLLLVTLKAEDEQKVSIPITREGMGFQIRASKPCIVHSVTHSGMAMNSGLVKGHAILTVNGLNVSKEPHDDVATIIRESCKSAHRKSATQDQMIELKSTLQQDESKDESSSSEGKLKKRKHALAKRIGISHTSLGSSKDKRDEDTSEARSKSSPPTLDLVVGNRHLERTCMYQFDNINGVRNLVVEKLSESASIFDLSAQLLEVLYAEDERVLSDLEALDDIQHCISEKLKEVYDRRKLLRSQVIKKRIKDYEDYKRHLSALMWPSYKKSVDKISDPDAKDFCPTNCHVNVMQVSHAKEKYNMRALGLPDQKTSTNTSNEDFYPENVENTSYSVTCMAAPSFRTRGKNHGLTAILGSVEEDSWMDKIRQLMVNFDAAVVELKRAQEELNRLLTEGKRDSMCSTISTRSDEYDPMSPRTSQYNNLILKSPSAGSPSNRISITSSTTTDYMEEEVTTILHNNAMPSFDNHKNQPSVALSTQMKDISLTNGDNESDMDSGIHSNRCSMVGSDGSSGNSSKFQHNHMMMSSQHGVIPENSNSPKKSASQKSNMRISALLINTSSQQNQADSTSTIKSSFSLPTLATTTSPISLNNQSNERSQSPVRMRNQKCNSRPGSRVTFSSHDRVSLISTTGSTVSSEGSDLLSFLEFTLTQEAYDKMHGNLMFFQQKIQSLHDLVHSQTVINAYKLTNETTPDRTFEKIVEGADVSFNVEAFRYAVSRCDSSEKFAEVMTTLMKSIEDHVKEIRTQLVLCVLLHEDTKSVERRDKVFSQTLTSAISSFSTQLRNCLSDNFNNNMYGYRNSEASSKWLEQIVECGVFVLFKTMLNPNEPNECSMLQDSGVGVYDLERVKFHFKPILGKVEANEEPSNCLEKEVKYIDVNGVGYTIEGNRCSLRVTFHLEKHVFCKLPPKLQTGQGVKLRPALINHGLQNLGEMIYEKDVMMQDYVNVGNEKAYSKMYDYYRDFRKFHFDKSRFPTDPDARAVLIDRLSRPLNALDELMTLISNHVKRNKGNSGEDLSSQGCGILTLASELCFRVGGCHIIACANGIHRSTISCAIHQATILSMCHGLPCKHLTTAQSIMVRSGARTYAVDKNNDVRDTTTSKNVPRLFAKFFK